MLHLSEHTGDATPGTLVYLYVDDLDAVAAEFGVAVTTQPWAREVGLTDPDGNRLRVGQVPPAVSRARHAVVTGASSGIGAATAARAGRPTGFDVVSAPGAIDRLRGAGRRDRRAGRRRSTSPTPRRSRRSCAAVPDCRLLVNNAGGALGLEPDRRGRRGAVARDVRRQRARRGAHDQGAAARSSRRAATATSSSSARSPAHEPYPGGARLQRGEVRRAGRERVLRLELLGRPVRVTEIDPGMVETEFSLVRFDGDAERAAEVYAASTPLTADDVAECIALGRHPAGHVNIDQIVVLARDQAGAREVHRRPT